MGGGQARCASVTSDILTLPPGGGEAGESEQEQEQEQETHRPSPPCPPCQGMRFDGVIPTLGQNASMWSTKDGRELSTYELAACMGHVMSESYYNEAPISESAMRKRLGLGMHVAACGSVMMALIASTAPAP